MTDQLPSKDGVSLDDLQRAIEFVPPHPGDCIPGQNVDQWLASLHEHRRWALEAWRMAFMWRDKDEWPRLSEYVKGMALIRELEGLRAAQPPGAEP